MAAGIRVQLFLSISLLFFLFPFPCTSDPDTQTGGRGDRGSKMVCVWRGGGLTLSDYYLQVKMVRSPIPQPQIIFKASLN